ncbi:MAG: hypothetical protein Q8N98_01300 [bacterium]|nr:hypothetical protein [bacterium]
MEESKRKQIAYTTGEASKICMCSQQTIIRCLDKGIIEGFYVSDSRHRRISSEGLFKYMKDNNIPLDNFPEKDLPKNNLEYRAKNKE